MNTTPAASQRGDAMRPTGVTRWLRTAASVATLIVLATCSSDDDDETGSPTTTDDSDTTSTTKQETTTTVAAEGPAEWVDVVQGLYGAYFDVLQQPDAAALEAIYAPSCPCWQQQADTVGFLAEEGEHMEGQPVSIHSVRLELDDPTGVVELTAKTQANPWRRVNEDGQTVQDLPGDVEPGCVALSLFPDGPAGAYRIHDQVALEACPAGT